MSINKPQHMDLKKISKEWKPEERLEVIRQLAEAIESKPQAARYAAQAIRLVATQSATFLENNRAGICHLAWLAGLVKWRE